LKTKKERKQKKSRTAYDTTTENQSNQACIFDETAQLFESNCQLLSHFCCEKCQMTGVTMRPSYKNQSVCTTCQALHANQENMNKDLPIWYDKQGVVQYNLPQQLKCLREGEKLLIQQVAAYVPLLHLKDGQIGSRGHVCSFVQDISSICTVLPRLPDNVQFVKIVKNTYKRVVKYQVKCLWSKKRLFLMHWNG
jgi:hypothetical protein